MKNTLFGTNIFDISLRILLALLPFTTLLSIWTETKLGIPGFSFYKETLLFIMFLTLVWYSFRGKIKITWSWIDWILLAYIATLVIITLFTTKLPGLIYGGRYDFSFLLTFWMMLHGTPLLTKKISFYLRIFLISGGIMLFFSGLLKWPLSEDLLLHFGYCGNPSNWQSCNGIPPIFHGIDGANVRRFQGILDGPNTMGAFLIMFSGIFAYYARMHRDWYFISGIILMGLLGMIVYTYSRSALLGTIAAILIAITFSFRSIYKKYKNEMRIILGIVTLIVIVVGIKYSGNGAVIINREGSTKGHMERMLTSIDRFKENPLGQGLASSGPAYRYIHPEVNAQNMDEMDRFYIPESWFIQQFVEGGIIGGILFIILMVGIFILILQQSNILAGMFSGILVMNFFLHTFESNVLSLSLFLIIGLILGEKRNHQKNIS